MREWVYPEITLDIFLCRFVNLLWNHFKQICVDQSTFGHNVISLMTVLKWSLHMYTHFHKLSLKLWFSLNTQKWSLGMIMKRQYENLYNNLRCESINSLWKMGSIRLILWVLFFSTGKIGLIWHIKKRKYRIVFGYPISWPKQFIFQTRECVV